MWSWWPCLFQVGSGRDRRGNNWYFHSRGCSFNLSICAAEASTVAHLINGCCPWESQRLETQPCSLVSMLLPVGHAVMVCSWIRSDLSSDSPRVACYPLTTFHWDHHSLLRMSHLSFLFYFFPPCPVLLVARRFLLFLEWQMLPSYRPRLVRLLGRCEGKLHETSETPGVQQ